jgi:uncharacterized membrane protein YqaE (UPF0057 family)
MIGRADTIVANRSEKPHELLQSISGISDDRGPATFCTIYKFLTIFGHIHALHCWLRTPSRSQPVGIEASVATGTGASFVINVSLLALTWLLSLITSR